MERVILIVLFSYYLYPILSTVIVRCDCAALLVGISESLVFILVCFRKQAQVISGKPVDWALAFAATALPLLARPSNSEPTSLMWLSIGIILVGLFIQVLAKLNLGRRFGVVPANRGICTRGVYRYVRHPMYLGYCLTHIGFLMSEFSIHNLTVYLMLYAIAIPRILAEEKLLKMDNEYADYCMKVRSRLIPGVF